LAVKVGLVPDPCVQDVCEALAQATVPIVVDPVLRASDGGALGATVSGVTKLARVAALVTPNLPEAAVLTGLDADDPTLPEAVESRVAPAAVLLKGGHDRDPARVIDRLRSSGHVSAFERPRTPGPEVRGTGCALATAIACALAGGASLEAAVGQSIGWLDEQREHCHVGPDGRLYLPI
jgi:hydroxymethylpyrimidine/phosphomethylpyrimidine kinase